MTGTGITRVGAMVVLAGAAGLGGWALLGGAEPTSTDTATPLTKRNTPIVVAVPARAAAAAPKPAVAPAPAAAPAPAPLLEIKRVLDLGAGIPFGDWAWNEQGAPAAGPLVVTIDLKAQTMSVFRDGHEIGASTLLYGATEKPTPLGVHPVRGKKRMHYSRTYGNAPMPYTLWLTDDGVAIHASDVKLGYATHGCIGVPPGFAAKLFDAVKPGDKVRITQGDRLLKVGDRIA